LDQQFSEIAAAVYVTTPNSEQDAILADYELPIHLQTPGSSREEDHVTEQMRERSSADRHAGVLLVAQHFTQG
jgi:hypothetical protein